MDDRIKAQREEQLKQDNLHNPGDNFQNVNRRRHAKEKTKSVNQQQQKDVPTKPPQTDTSNHHIRSNKRIIIKEPTIVNQLPMIVEVAGKGKGKVTNKKNVSQDTRTSVRDRNIEYLYNKADTSNQNKKKNKKISKSKLMWNMMKCSS